MTIDLFPLGLFTIGNLKETYMKKKTAKKVRKTTKARKSIKKAAKSKPRKAKKVAKRSGY